MSYVEKHLLPGEEVRYRAHLHRVGFTGAYTIAGIAGLTMVSLFLFPDTFPRLWVGAGLALVAAAAVGWAEVRYRASEFAVTNKRVVIKIGWIKRRTIETLLSKVESIGVEQGISGRMVNRGTIVVTGTGGTEERFANIADPLEFRRQVQAQVSADEDRRGDSLRAGADARAAVAAGPGEARQERECPYCAERILAKAKVCKYCGRDVVPTAE
jgi:uncharacterized membrane protein YdbT with pleckstrin-like domain